MLPQQVWPLPGDEQPVTILELRPAEAVLPDGTVVTRAQARVTRVGVYVWAERNGGVALVYAAARTDLTERVPSETQARQTPALVTTPDGTLTLNRVPGCGCSAVWRSFVPWTPDRRGA